MKIKQKRQVRLDELLKYVWDNDLTDCKFYDESEEPIFIIGTNSSLKNTDYVGKNDLFTITEEVEVTEETELNLVDIYKDYGLPLQLAFEKNVSIKELLAGDKESKLDTIYIHLQNEDGSIGDLIWSKERGLVD